LEEIVFDMVAILGRGTHRISEGGPFDMTEDLEVCDGRSAHLAVRVPADDENPFCMIGGGQMNLEAGICLIRKYDPAVIVCAYGGRSEYLESIDGPSESEVMGEALEKAFSHDPLKITSSLVTWERHRQLPVPSNTRQELLNIFDLAIERGLGSIAVVTIGVHVARTATYVAKHMSVYPQYRSLRVVVLESEEVLLAENREKYTARVEAMRTSKSFARNWGGTNREADGISKIIRDVYGDAKPKVIVA
jgi:hypothetical protein